MSYHIIANIEADSIWLGSDYPTIAAARNAAKIVLSIPGNLLNSIDICGDTDQLIETVRESAPE